MPAIRLLLSDVDGTLVTSDKDLTAQTIAAVHRLHENGVAFAVTSGRPPRGMEMLIEPLALSTPLSAFNGGLVVEPGMGVLEQRVLPDGVVTPVLELIAGFGLDAWLYRGADWYVRDLDGAHVAHEAGTVGFGPTRVASFDGMTQGIAKVVGISDDLDAVAAASVAANERFGAHVAAARSQPYYLDVTHPDANKGGVVTFLSTRLDIPAAQIATIGDGPNDVRMFERSGMSIAMGNAGAEVQAAATHVTAGNDEQGFAAAVERFVLPAL